MVRGIVILGATEEKGGGGEASFCDVQHSGSAGGEENLRLRKKLADLKVAHLLFLEL